MFAVTGCSRKKNSFISRNYHAVTTEFNTLFNGQNAFDAGMSEISNDFSDNFWEVLPIERLKISDEIIAPGQAQNSNFERAEEKATKAIQKHSINIDGKEKNPQIDEAYLLLGKARYFDQRFVPAIEAFNYILFKYPASDKINAAKIWREKVNIRLENNELAIENLKKLLERAELRPQDYANATSSLAQAYLNLKHVDSAITQLELASNYTKDNNERGRYRFIQGQLYNSLDKKDSANYAFDKVIELNRKTSRIYLITAHLEKAKNFDYENGDKIALLEGLIDLEKNRENRPFLDKIYREFANYHLKNESDTLAVNYFNKSLRTNSNDKILVAKNYESIGNISFDNTKFKTAGTYFDSTLVNLQENTKFYRAIKKKRDNLEDVILYEDLVQRNDSILKLVNLPEDERLAFFRSYTDSLKVIAEASAKTSRQQQARTNIGNSPFFINNNTSSLGGTQQQSNGGPFYFYNPTAVAFGKNNFSQRWGDRELGDNWRLSSAASVATNNSGVPTIDASGDLIAGDLYDPEYYIAQLPSESTEIDSIQRDRNFAYYQLGLIYKEKFKEYNLAKDRLKTVLDSNPEERLVLPSKYNLYKIYQLLDLQGEAEIAKNDIVKNHPDSRYATILLNPESVLTEDENSPENIYGALYARFEMQDYNYVISECDKYISVFDGESIVPKYEFLKAVSKGRLQGFETYKESVNFIALNYPNSDEGERAEEMLRSVFPLIENKEFVADDTENSFKAIYEFKEENAEKANTFIKNLDKAIAGVQHFKLNTSKDIYNNTITFVVVHGFNSIEGASGFVDFIKENRVYKEQNPEAYEQIISRGYFGISSKNYEIIQIHKNVDDYLKTNSK